MYFFLAGGGEHNEDAWTEVPLYTVCLKNLQLARFQAFLSCCSVSMELRIWVS